MNNMVDHYYSEHSLDAKLVESWHSSAVFNSSHEIWDSRNVNEKVVVRMTDGNTSIRSDSMKFYCQEDEEFDKITVETLYAPKAYKNGIHTHEMPALSPAKTSDATSSDSTIPLFLLHSQTLGGKAKELDVQLPTSRQTTIYQVEKEKRKKGTEEEPLKMAMCEKEDCVQKNFFIDSSIVQTGHHILSKRLYEEKDEMGKNFNDFDMRAIQINKYDSSYTGENGESENILQQFLLGSKILANEFRRLNSSYILEEENSVLRIYIEPDSKEEILTITSPSPDECTDSGIENNRYTSTPHSPSTSTDFSPRSDKNIFSSSGVDRRIISPTNRFIRPASPSIEDVPPPLPMNPPPPLPLEHEEEFIKDLELDMDKRDIDQNTSYKTPNRTSSEESLKLDQVVVGLTLKKDQTSESEYKSIFADRETIVKTTSTTYPSHFDSLTRPTITEQVEKPSQFIKETTANFNCQKTYEENARVDAVVAQQAHDSTSKHVIKEAKLWKQNLMKEIPLEISPLATMETTKKADSSRDKSTRTVSVGVEVCREQNAKVSAFKFPHKLSRESVVFTVKPASKMTPTVSHFRAVDIPFDDTPNMVETHTANGLEGGNLPDSNGLMVVKMQLSAAEFQGFDNHGFGFSIKGGKEQNAPLTVDTVVVNTAADRCGLQVGDIVLSINGESTVDRYYQTARRMLNEAIRLGEVEVQIQRSPVPLTTFHKDTNKEPESQLTKSPSFDDRRIVFERKPSESNSYYEFKQKKRFEGSPDSVAKASGSISSISPQSSKSSDYGHDDTASDHLTDSKESDSLQRLHRRTPKKMSRSGSPDYRVVSLDEKRDPGKLDDFVPEVEREGRKSNKDNEDDENTLPRVPSRKTDRNEEPKLIRNYDLNLVKSSNESLHSIKSRNSFQKESVSTTDGNKENDTSLERPVVLDELDSVKVLHRVPDIETIELVRKFEHQPMVDKREVEEEPKIEEKVFPYKEPRPDYPKDEPKVVTLAYKNAEILDMPLPPTKTHLAEENTHLAEEEDVDEIYSKIDETREDSAKKSSPHSESKVFIVQHKVPISPVQSPRQIKYQYVREREEERYESVEDGDGYTIPHMKPKRAPYAYSYHHTPQNADLPPTKNRPVYRREVPIYIERKPVATSTLPSTPYNRSGVPYSSIYSPPSFERPYELGDEANVSRVTYRFYDRNMQEVNPATRISKVDRARRATRSFEDGIEIFGRNVNYSPQVFEENRVVESRDTREWRQFVREQRLPNPGHTSSLNRIDADSKFQIIHKPNSGVANISPTSRPIITTVHRIPSGNKHEVREIPVKLQTTSYASPQKPSRRNDSTATQQSRDEPIMSVSGKHRCAHCDQELGRGAAMIIESLNLFYHLSCFRCYVCNIALGNGTKGADVRVRDAKLHCQKCYSNDEVGMKFSQI